MRTRCCDGGGVSDASPAAEAAGRPQKIRLPRNNQTALEMSEEFEPAQTPFITPSQTDVSPPSVRSLFESLLFVPSVYPGIECVGMPSCKKTMWLD
jgi:hypothetical protein